MARLNDIEQEFLVSAEAPLDLVLGEAGGGGEGTAARAMPGLAVAMEIDARAQARPMPLLLAGRAMDRLQPGEVLRVLTRGAGIDTDFQAFARCTGHQLLAQHDHGAHVEHLFRRR